MKNFYDLLTWRDATKNSFPERLFFYPPDEFSGDLKIYISFEEREAHLTQRSVHVGFADNAVPTQILENFLKLVAELWKHAVVSAAPFNEWRSPDAHGSLETAAPWHRAFISLAFALLAVPLVLGSPQCQTSSALRPSFLGISR